MQTIEQTLKRQTLEIAVPDAHGAGCVRTALVLEIPDDWVLAAVKHKPGTTVGESLFDFELDGEGKAHVRLESRSLGDELTHTPASLLKAQEQAMRRRYWVRSFQGKSVPAGGKFERALTKFPLYVTKAELSPKPQDGLRKVIAALRREPPSEVWHTECFKLFRFQVLLICMGSVEESGNTRDALHLLSKQMTLALARYAAGRVR